MVKLEQNHLSTNNFQVARRRGRRRRRHRRRCRRRVAIAVTGRHSPLVSKPKTLLWFL